MASLILTCGVALVPAAGVVAAVPGVATLAAAQALLSGGMSLFSVNQISLRQAITPFALLGRINATRRLLVFGVAPMGALVGGAIGTAFGLRAALLAAAAIELLALLIAYASPLRTLRAQPADTPNRNGGPTH
jgi:hypothetical protein